MLRNCILPASYGQTRASKRCGEIICNDNINFTIICVLCRMKLFEYDDFQLHYQNVHLRGNATTHSDGDIDGELEEVSCIKNEDFENIKYINNSCTGGCVSDMQQPVRILGGNAIKSERTEAMMGSQTYADNDTAHGCYMESTYEGTNDATVDAVVDYEDEDDDTKSDAEWKMKQEEIEDNHILKKPRKPKEYTCEYCRKSYTTEHILRLHINMKHLRPKDFKCDQCGEGFSEQRSLDSHAKREHIGYVCTLCERTYKSSRSLRIHVETHTNERPYKCDYENCEKSFITASRLKMHKKIHTEERNYVCEVCGFRTRQKDALVVHKRTHTGERPFECTICKKRFISASLLNEHKAMHSTERPHKCEVCGAAFSRPKALYHHKYLHLGEKKFKCKLCGRAYAQMAGLAGHMRQHRAEEQSLKT